MNIQEMHDMRKAICTCKKLFLYPAYHEDGCEYKVEGMKYLDAFEKEAERIQAEEGVHA